MCCLARCNYPAYTMLYGLLFIMTLQEEANINKSIMCHIQINTNYTKKLCYIIFQITVLQTVICVINILKNHSSNNWIKGFPKSYLIVLNNSQLAMEEITRCPYCSLRSLGIMIVDDLAIYIAHITDLIFTQPHLFITAINIFHDLMISTTDDSTYG